MGMQQQGLLSTHGAVKVVVEMLHENPNLSIQADCLDALVELVCLTCH